MTEYQIYNERKLNNGIVWLLFLFFGWSYGSMGSIGKQIFFYLTCGGFGLWFLYRLFTLQGAIKKYNRGIAVSSGLGREDIEKLGLS